MLFENNPATAQLHSDWRQRITNEFSDTDFSNSSDYLCLVKYLDKSPQKFYSKEAFTQYLFSLEDIKKNEPNVLADILKGVEPLLSISNRILTEINEKPIHDILLPKEHNDLIN